MINILQNEPIPLHTTLIIHRRAPIRVRRCVLSLARMHSGLARGAHLASCIIQQREPWPMAHCIEVPTLPRHPRNRPQLEAGKRARCYSRRAHWRILSPVRLLPLSLFQDVPPARYLYIATRGPHGFFPRTTSVQSETAPPHANRPALRRRRAREARACGVVRTADAQRACGAARSCDTIREPVSGALCARERLTRFVQHLGPHAFHLSCI